MRNQLFKCEITRGDRLVTGFLVAPEKERASELLFQNEIEINRENLGFSLERIDETLPLDQRKGLDALLQCGCIGLASYSQALGWITHSVPSPKLHLFRIHEAEGDDYFIIAPTGDVAAAVYCEASELKENEARLFRILDGFFGLKPDCARGLAALLEYGPIGVVAWDDERGWRAV